MSTRVSTHPSLDLRSEKSIGNRAREAVMALIAREELKAGDKLPSEAELAQMFNIERGCKADLSVVKLENWRRDAWYDETGLPWTNPSPNMRNLNEAILYPGIGLLESAVSVGRGTGTPFEVVGAPYIEDRKLAAEMNQATWRGAKRSSSTLSDFSSRLMSESWSWLSRIWKSCGSPASR